MDDEDNLDDDLLTKAKEAFPDEPDEVIQQGISKVKELHPDASTDQVINIAKQAQGHASAQPSGPEESPSMVGMSPQVSPDESLQNTAVKKYITQLYGDKFSPEARNKILAQNQDEARSPDYGAGFAALGAGLQGKDAVQAGQEFKKQERATRDARIADFDKGKSQLAADFEMGRKIKSDTEGQEVLDREKDPNSPESKLAQEAAAKMGVKPEVTKNLTAQQFKAQGPIYEKIYAVEQKKLDRQQEKANQNTERTKREQGQALLSTNTILDGARQSVGARAEQDIYAAKKAKSLANMYGDPNKLSNEQVKLLASEIGKIASGGTPSMHELEGITPSTLAGQLSGVVTKFTNSPTKANAGAFVKQYQDYANQLTKDAQETIKERYGRVIESRKNHLSPEDYNSLQEQYIHRFDDANVDQPKFEPDVTAYAQEHGITPEQAQAIKQKRMGQ